MSFNCWNSFLRISENDVDSVAVVDVTVMKYINYNANQSLNPIDEIFLALYY